jgi:hypothetical protein
VRNSLAALVALLLSTLLNAATIDLLEEDWSVAVTEAQQSGKTLFVAFLGDGWSVSSKRFQEAVLDDPEFKAFASSRLVYCPVLARSHPKLGKTQTARLQSLVIHLDIKSYPTFILIAPDETEILRHGYRDETAKEYVALLEALLPLPKSD